jgi:hypothetical protein
MPHFNKSFFFFCTFRRFFFVPKFYVHPKALPGRSHLRTTPKGLLPCVSTRVLWRRTSTWSAPAVGPTWDLSCVGGMKSQHSLHLTSVPMLQPSYSRVKNIPEPIRPISISWDGSGWTVWASHSIMIEQG